MDEDDEREEPVSRPRASGAGRTFLLLQGPMSWFFTYLGASLRERGATVHRILVCPGDALFWRGPNGVAYRGKPRDWPIYLEAFMKNRGVTDIVCLGDGRRWHDDAVGVGVWVSMVELEVRGRDRGESRAVRALP